MFRFLILGLLRSRGRMHGYALVKEYRRRSGAEVSSGNFYRELQRLVVEGLICSAANPPEADVRRTPYEITDEGTTLFDDWLTAHTAAAGRIAEDDLSARALFIGELDPSLAAAVLDRLQDNLWLWGKRLERDRRLLVAQGGAAERTGAPAVLPLLLARRMKHVSADLDFIEALSQRLADAAAAGEGAPGRVGPKARPAQKREPPPPTVIHRRA
jgi:DNA-binding PadR family transcriptional regulator